MKKLHFIYLIVMIFLVISACTNTTSETNSDLDFDIKAIFYEMEMEKFLTFDEVEIPVGLEITETDVRKMFEKYKDFDKYKERRKSIKGEKEKLLEAIKNAKSPEEKSALLKEVIDKGYMLTKKPDLK